MRRRSSAWRDEQVAILDRAARPKAALEFPFVPMLREMVFAAMSQAEMKTLTPAEWRARVKSLAAPPRRGRGAGGVGDAQIGRVSWDKLRR